jgi:transposase
MEPEMTKNRRNFTPEQKVTILREHLVERVAVSDVCDKHHIHPTLFYQWQSRALARQPALPFFCSQAGNIFFEKGTAAFESGRSPSRVLGHQERKLLALESKLAMRNEALAELMEEHVRFKKSLGED